MEVPYSFANQYVVDRKSRFVTRCQRKAHAEPKDPATETRSHYSRRVNLDQYFRRFHYCDTQTLGNQHLAKRSRKAKISPQLWPHTEDESEYEAQNNRYHQCSQD